MRAALARQLSRGRGSLRTSRPLCSRARCTLSRRVSRRPGVVTRPLARLRQPFGLVAAGAPADGMRASDPSRNTDQGV